MPAAPPDPANDNRRVGPPVAALVDALMDLTSGAPRERRNLLLGLWASRRLGFEGQQSVLYALSVLAADRAPPDDAGVIARLAADLAAARMPADEALLRAALAAAARRARAPASDPG